MARDRRPALVAAVLRKQATRDRCHEAAFKAQRAYRLALMQASDAGISKNELARITGAGDSRVRQLINQAKAETE